MSRFDKKDDRLITLTVYLELPKPYYVWSFNKEIIYSSIAIKNIETQETFSYKISHVDFKEDFKIKNAELYI
jgi:hypothetical protein